MSTKITTPIGEDKTIQVAIRDIYGNAVTSYTGAEPLVGQVWRGGDQPVLFSPSVVWDVPANGTIKATFLGTDTQHLESGDYQVRITVNGSSIPDSTLVLLSSPGDAAPLKAYCTYQDMYDYFSDMGEILDPDDQTGFARQRYKARTWTDRMIQANRRNATGYTSYGLGGSMIYGYGAGTYTSQTDPILQGYLDDDLLMRRPLLIEMNARMALAYACEGEIGPGDKTSQWQELAAGFRSEAEVLACMYVAEIDLNNDGYSDITINCGMASNR